MTNSSQVRIVCCGGTIDKVYFDMKSDFQVGHPQAVDVLQESNVTLNYTIQSLLQKDSLDLTDQDRLAVRDAVLSAVESRIIVTHGTDSMIDTAKILESIIGKTVVLTGAMVPARFRDTDALFNLGFALGAVQALSPGVYIAMHGRILDPNKIRKNRELGRFEDLT